MKNLLKKLKLVFVSFFQLVVIFDAANAQTDISYSKEGQAMAPATQMFGSKAFEKNNHTEIKWLGNSGFLINSHGTTMMIDPLLKGFDMPLMIEIPILSDQVPHLDAVLITHIDDDHFSIATNDELKAVTDAFHSTNYVDSVMKTRNYPSYGYDIGAQFKVNDLIITLSPALHNWQNEVPEFRQNRFYKLEDYCGFWIETQDGTSWATGDSKLLPEHLKMPSPDVILFDFSDNEWHFTLEGAIELANSYPNAELLLHHWGSVDAPDFSPFNADPNDLFGKVSNPERIKILAPGESFLLQK